MPHSFPTAVRTPSDDSGKSLLDATGERYERALMVRREHRESAIFQNRTVLRTRRVVRGEE